MQEDQPQKNVLLYKALQEAIGEIEPHIQPVEGDCVAHATAMACDVLAAVNVYGFGKEEAFVAKAAVEPIYWGSRVEVGKNAIQAIFGGSQVWWAAEYVSTYGVLHRLHYVSGDDEIDLTEYDGARSRSRRSLGVPDWLEPIAKRHPVKVVTRCTTSGEVIAAIRSGQPVAIGSSYAFENVRDEYGFSKPYLGCERCQQRGRKCRNRKKWYHAMVITGVILEGPKQGVIFQNSMGDWNSGPRPNDIPKGAFGVEIKYLDIILNDRDFEGADAWALSSYEGYQAVKMYKRLEALR